MKKSSQGAAALNRLRKLCLSLPETTEKEAWETPTFRVRGKMFAMFVDDYHGDGRIGIWCKAPLGYQSMLVDADPKRYFVPPYVGHKGWIGMRLDLSPDWKEVAAVVEDAYRVTAPAKLAAAFAAGGDEVAKPVAAKRRSRSA